VTLCVSQIKPTQRDANSPGKGIDVLDCHLFLGGCLPPDEGHMRVEDSGTRREGEKALCTEKKVQVQVTGDVFAWSAVLVMEDGSGVWIHLSRSVGCCSVSVRLFWCMRPATTRKVRAGDCNKTRKVVLQLSSTEDVG
jgi:hypothetical protein